MNNYAHIAIPKILIERYNDFNLTTDEVMLLIQLLTINDSEVNLIDFLEKFEISKSKVNLLLTKKVVSLLEKDGGIFISLTPLYEIIYNFQENQVDNIELTALNSAEIDKLKYIFNRDIKPFELEQIKGWKKQGFDFKQIEDAIYKALVKNVTNLNYIQAILQNEISEVKESTNKEEVSVVRNWTFD